MPEIITRFAPSPTGMLHIGNVRTALINYLYTKKHNGKFILRIDNTDVQRSKQEFEKAIKEDLKRLSIIWDETFDQMSKLEKYELIKNQLIESGRLYPCYETPEELEIKRKLQLSNGKPPIYDRAALKLTKEQKDAYEKSGRKPHYRFLINEEDIIWQDLIKGTIKYQGSKLSDPIIIRADKSMTYMLCSTVDDIDAKITHVIRGEDHVSNTAIQIQLFDALGALKIPQFAHLSLIKTKDSKISKRDGGYDIRSIIDNNDILPMAINSFLALIGTSKNVQAYKNMNGLIKDFDIKTFSTSPTTYSLEELEHINHKLVMNLDYDEVKIELKKYGNIEISEDFWLAVRANIKKLSEVKDWYDICNSHKITEEELNKNVLRSATENLPTQIDGTTWKKWTSDIAQSTGIKGKEMFMTLRLAITGLASGPELKNLLPLLARNEIIKRLNKFL